MFVLNFLESPPITNISSINTCPVSVMQFLFVNYSCISDLKNNSTSANTDEDKFICKISWDNSNKNLYVIYL